MRQPTQQKVDVQVAFNFSYFVFHTRADLLEYFTSAHASLEKPGLFFLDLFGGTESLCVMEEKTKIGSSLDPDGRRVPPFTYLWDQARFNPIDHRIVCHIHFELGKGKRMRRAFTYDWRFWTLPEIRELLAEAGFRESKVYVEGWDDETDETDGIFRMRKRFDNEGSWIAYVVAKKV